MNSNIVIEQAVESNQVSMTLKDHCVEYQTLNEKLIEIKNSIKELKEKNPAFPKIEELQNELTELKNQIKDNNEYQELKENLDSIKDDLCVEDEIILGLMKESQQTLFEMPERKCSFAVDSKLKYKKLNGKRF